MCTALVGEEDELSELHRKIKSQTKEETKPKMGGWYDTTAHNGASLSQDEFSKDIQPGGDQREEQDAQKSHRQAGSNREITQSMMRQ